MDGKHRPAKQPAPHYEYHAMERKQCPMGLTGACAYVSTFSRASNKDRDSIVLAGDRSAGHLSAARRHAAGVHDLVDLVSRVIGDEQRAVGELEGVHGPAAHGRGVAPGHVGALCLAHVADQEPREEGHHPLRLGFVIQRDGDHPVPRKLVPAGYYDGRLQVVGEWRGGVVVFLVALSTHFEAQQATHRCGNRTHPLYTIANQSHLTFEPRWAKKMTPS